MSGARPIGEIIAPIVTRARRLGPLQEQLALMSTPARRKGLIMAAYESCLIDAADCQLLIEAHGLETA